MSEKDILDPAALARLREWGGDKLLLQMARLFLDNSPARVEQIRVGSKAGGDVQEAEKGAHSLKSSAANVGANELREIAAAMERHAGGGAQDALSELLPDLESAYARVREALEEIVRGTES